MHEHISLQDFVLLVFSIGTPFCICFYCSLRCLNTYLKAIQNAEIQANSEDFESESESDSENGYHREDELLSPRSIRVINKYGHYKPDYSSESLSEEEFSSLSEYSDQEDGEILTERQIPESVRRVFNDRTQAYG